MGGTPKSPIFMRFSHINKPFLETLIDGNHQMTSSIQDSQGPILAEMPQEFHRWCGQAHSTAIHVEQATRGAQDLRPNSLSLGCNCYVYVYVYILSWKTRVWKVVDLMWETFE